MHSFHMHSDATVTLGVIVAYICMHLFRFRYLGLCKTFRNTLFVGFFSKVLISSTKNLLFVRKKVLESFRYKMCYT